MAEIALKNLLIRAKVFKNKTLLCIDAFLINCNLISRGCEIQIGSTFRRERSIKRSNILMENLMVCGTTYRENGKLEFRRDYKSSLLYGIWEEYDEENYLIKTLTYKDGEVG